MATSKNLLKQWFKTGKRPTQEQFWAWMDSYWHKDEKIGMRAIDGLSEAILGKAEQEAVTILIERTKYIKYVVIEGNPFEYRPVKGNDGSSFQLGDLALNGWHDQTTFWKIASYSGNGDPTKFVNWIPIESI